MRVRNLVGLVLSLVLFATAVAFVVFREKPAVRRIERLALFWGVRARLKIADAKGFLFRKMMREGAEEGAAGAPVSVSPYLFLDAQDFTYSVKPVFNDSYFGEVLEAIESAQKSVKVAVSHMDRGKRNSPADRLVQALADARGRGVDVEVVLDYPQSRFGKAAETGPYKKNEEAIDFLKRKGCNASFDTPERALHDKLILIDDGLAVIGTHDWTDDSLSANDEVSVLVKCSPTSAIFQEHFEEIERAKKPESREMRLKEILKKQKELLGR